MELGLKEAGGEVLGVGVRRGRTSRGGFEDFFSFLFLFSFSSFILFH